MSTTKTESKKASEQNNDDRNDFDSKLIYKLDEFVSKLVYPEENYESLQKINEDIKRLDSNLVTLETLKSRSETQIKTSSNIYSDLLAENNSLKNKLGMN